MSDMPHDADRMNRALAIGKAIASRATSYKPTTANYARVQQGATLGALQALDDCADLLAALEYAVAQYGKPGGPWNVPSDPGGWLDRARAAIARAHGAA